MAKALGITQGAITGVLARLVAAGVLGVRTSHVRGHDRRVKVYELTPMGENLVLDLRRRQTGGSRASETRVVAPSAPPMPPEPERRR